MTDERRAFREKLRLVAAERFRHGEERAVVAHDLRVSVRSVQRRRKPWSRGGPKAPASRGTASLPPLSDELFTVLERELLKGPVAHGWPDQTWALSRIKTLFGRRFRKSYTKSCTVQGVAALLKRHDWTCQVRARRASRPACPAGKAWRVAFLEEHVRLSIDQLNAQSLLSR
ncbi:winged helix-turn-helix domain-containing protein [Streptomyces sp. NPDC057363]|uniref:winged helix-turn-helix domain-containing protein n=1 Tax=Streptomyces sp. NPDC057363 TaxID=3346107 RepID=UPI003641F79C